MKNMKKNYPLLMLLFIIILMMKYGDAYSQDDGALSQSQQQPENAIMTFPPRDIPPPARGGGNPNPNPGSIWVNRNESPNGKPVTALTPEQLVRDVLMGQGGDDPCAMGGTISNVVFTGHGWNQGTKTWTEAYDRGLSYFSHGTVNQSTIVTIGGINYTVITSLDMESGLLLTTGGGRNAEGPNSQAGHLGGGGVSLSGDPDLNSLGAGTIQTGAMLEFDFIPMQHEISFDYIFASEEYPEFVHASVNDAFGFFISGPGIPGGKQNIALLPTTSTGNYVVTINNVNNGSSGGNSPNNFPGSNPKNAQYYVGNYNSNPQGTYMEYDGRTVILTARSSVIPGQTYHLKLAIANVGDGALGSGVFLRAGSLDLGSGLINLGPGGLEINNVFEGC